MVLIKLIYKSVSVKCIMYRKAQPAVNTDELAQLFVQKFNENAFCLGQLVTIEFGSQLFKAEVIQMTGTFLITLELLCSSIV